MLQAMDGAPKLQDMVMSICEPARESDLESYTSVQQVRDQMMLMHQIGTEDEEDDDEDEDEDEGEAGEYRDTIGRIVSMDIQASNGMYYEMNPTRSHSRSSTDLNTSSCSRSSSFDTRINGVGGARRGGGAACGNKPHKAQDGAWEAIRRVKLRDGGLGLGHFRFLQRLGSGDIGSVYLAELKMEEDDDDGEEEEDDDDDEDEEEEDDDDDDYDDDEEEDEDDEADSAIARRCSNPSMVNSSHTGVATSYSLGKSNPSNSCTPEYSKHSSAISDATHSSGMAEHSSNNSFVSHSTSFASIAGQSSTNSKGNGTAAAIVQSHGSMAGTRKIRKSKASTMIASSSSSVAATCPNPCPLFAVKVMDKRALAGRNKLLRAQTEREILEALDHPFLPTLYAHLDERHFSCLVMEFCPGGDLHVLRQRQPSKRFCENAVRFYAAEVLLALEYLHMMGIVYRDLKPENVLVREDGHIMLSDFDLSLKCSVNPILSRLASVGQQGQQQGSSSLSCLPSGKGPGSCELRVLGCVAPCSVHPIASCLPMPRFLSYVPRSSGAALKASRRSKSSTVGRRPLPELIAEPTSVRSMSFVGTHEYLAPEIIIGDGHGSAVDWWTFGIFLFELLHGHTPFKGADNEKTLMNVVTQPLKFPASSSSSLADPNADPFPSLAGQNLIRGLLVKDPNKRLAATRGASEVKQHPFFQGVNWALIRCAIPPEIPSPFVRIDDRKHESNQCLHHSSAVGKHKWAADDSNNGTSEDFAVF